MSATDSHDPDDFAWAVPVMRTGYGGRGLVYLVVAGVSLWSLFHGGSAEGTKQVLEKLSSGWGAVVLVAIALGMAAYAIWRVVDALWDLEAYGDDIKGWFARIGLVVSGLVHLGIGGIAVTALVARASGDSGTSKLVSTILSAPMGRIALGVIGLIVIGAGGYYLYKGITKAYLKHLQANEVTRRANIVLQAGLVAQGVVIAIMGALIVYAAYSYDPSSAGGLGKVFDWLRGHPFGQVLTGAICVGLLGFAVFCFVNAIYRIVPRASDPDIETLKQSLESDD